MVGLEGAEFGDFAAEVFLFLAKLVDLFAGDHAVSAWQEEAGKDESTGDESAEGAPGGTALMGVIGADNHGVVDRFDLEEEVFAGEGGEFARAGERVAEARGGDPLGLSGAEGVLRRLLS
jgi:hypothetical protein